MTRARQPYLKALLQFAAGNGRPEISLAPSLLTRHHLTQRVAMILTEVSMSRNRICAYLVIICALLLAAGRMTVAWFPLAAPARSERNTQQKAQPAPEKPQQEPVRVDLQMQPPKLIHRVDAVYPKEAKDKGLQTRVVLEKPIGHYLASSKAINDAVGAVFREDQIFRIDHYLGKEAVQNLLALRFANTLFEPVWIPRNGKDSNGIPYIVITCTECLRSFPLSVAVADLQKIQETPCLFCPNTVRYVIDFSLSIASPRPEVVLKSAANL